MQIKTVLARMLMVIAIASGFLGWMPAIAARADGLDGDTYASEEDGWSVEFDGRVWEVEEIDESSEQGIMLDGGRTFARIAVRDDGREDADECLDSRERELIRSDGWEDLRPAKRLEPPDSEHSRDGSLLAGTLVFDNGNEEEVVFYIECRELNDATLSVLEVAFESSYDNDLAKIESLPNGIKIGPVRSSSQDDDNDEDSGSGSTSGARDTITIGGGDGSSPSKRVSLDAGQYRVSVRGTASGDFGGLFSVTIEGSGYDELPINEVIQGSGPYAASSEVFIDSSGSATISVTTLGLDDWTLTLTLVDPA